jgi:hypothetical protein
MLKTQEQTKIFSKNIRGNELKKTIAEDGKKYGQVRFFNFQNCVRVGRGSFIGSPSLLLDKIILGFPILLIRLK